MRGAATLALEGPSAAPIDLPSLARPPRNWVRSLGPLFSIAILLAVFRSIRHLDFATELRHLPHNPLFWGLFVLSWCAVPFSEWVIFRHLWPIPKSGVIALLRKQISNELLIGYLGESYFYGWARQQVKMTNAPFGAIKDVTILSAVCGSAVALVMLPFAFELLRSQPLGVDHGALTISISLIGASFALPLLFRRKLFSLPREQLGFVTRIHLVRIVFGLLCTADMWHMLLPHVELGWWCLLLAIRQLVSRLPLVPDKDVLFVGIAVFFLGRQFAITDALALMASLSLALNIAVGTVIGVTGLFCRGAHA